MATAKVPVSDRTLEVVVEYDDQGYTILIDGRVASVRRLEAICYQMDAQRRREIALKHALSDIRCELPAP